MMMRVAGAVVIAAFLLVAPTGAGANPPEVNIQFAAFAPSQLDVLPGETVNWSNVSERTHTVTSDTGLFASGDVPGGKDLRVSVQHRRYLQLSLHDSSEHGRGDRRAAGDPRAPAHGAGRGRRAGRLHRPHRRPGAAGQHPDEQGRDHLHHGRQCDTRPRRDLAGDTRGHRDGRLPGGSRCRCEPDPEAPWLENPHIRIHATRSGVSVTVTPSSPYARIVVEVHLRARFGWWPVSAALLNYVSEADIRVLRPLEYASSSSTRTGWGPRSRRVP